MVTIGKDTKQLSWFQKGTIYQVYPRSYNDSNGDGIGDIRGVIRKLDYIKNLHVDIIWISPIFQSPNDDNGYDVSDYCTIMPEFGTMEDFDELLSKAHQKGLKLILDLVANHCSDEHDWFKEAKKSIDNRYRNYFHWRKPSVNGGPPNNWKSFFGGSAWEYDETSGEYYLHMFTKKQPDLNWENPNLREEMYDIMRFWLDKGVDGFRMDVIPLISKDHSFPDTSSVGFREILKNNYANGPLLHEYLQEMNREVMRCYDAFSLGEGVGVDVENAGLYVNNDRNELDMIYHFDILECTAMNGKYAEPSLFDLGTMKKIFKKWREALHEKGWMANALGNHDFARMVSRFGNDNRYWKESAKMLITMQATQNGTLNLYQGDEIGMTNVILTSIDEVDDVQSRNFYNENLETKKFTKQDALSMINKEGRDNARTPMQWSSEQNAGFTIGTPWLGINENFTEINVKAQENDPDSILNYYRALLKVRKENDVFVYGEFEEIDFENPNVYIYTKTLGDEKIEVFLNFSTLYLDYECNGIKVLIDNYNDTIINSKKINLRPYQSIILRC